MILKAEQADPDSASNIAVFKEQRDAADHLMRILGAIHIGPPEDLSNTTPEEYVATHLEKARGHLFRAAFDSLDGIGLSSKLLLKSALEQVSNEAISAVFPAYWEKVVEFDELDEQVTAHRRGKDIGNNTIAHLESYVLVVERLQRITQEVRRYVPQLHAWDDRNRARLQNEQKAELKTGLKKGVVTHLVFLVVGGLLVAVFEGPMKNLLTDNKGTQGHAAVLAPQPSSTNTLSTNSAPATRASEK